MAPTDKDVGHDFLDMTLRDMRGVLHTTIHQLTHARDFLDTSRMPCWTCTKVGSRQKKKFQAQFRKAADKHPKRLIQKFGDLGTGDHVAMTDFHGRGGVQGDVHSSGPAYQHPLRHTDVKKDDEQTLKAINHIYGNDPRRRYYSDNRRALRNAAEMAGMQHESCLPGIHQTNGIAESNNRSILSGTRRLLMQAGLPACWWPYAAPCFCFLESITLAEDQSCAYYERHGVHFPWRSIPCGQLVYYVPAPTKDNRGKAEPSMQAGIFLGYRLAPGGRWEGDYLVADLNDFQGLPMHSKAELGLFKNVRPHTTRPVKRAQHGVHFPLFEH